MSLSALRNLAVVAAALAVGACADSTVTSPAKSVASGNGPAYSVAGGQQKVNICHVTGNGTYILLNVAQPAVPAHLNHGDGFPGDVVPNYPLPPGYFFALFAPDCSVTLVGGSPT